MEGGGRWSVLGLLREKLKAKLASLRSSLLSSLGFTDIVLVASEEEETVPVPADRFILAKHSPVFKAMFEKEMMETIKICDTSYNAVYAMVNFIYTGETLLDEEMAYELLVLAEKYQLKHLKCYCEKFLVTKLNWDNSGWMLAFAVQQNAEHLEKRSLDLIIANMDKFLAGKVHPVLRKEAPEAVLKIYQSYLIKFDS